MQELFGSDESSSSSQYSTSLSSSSEVGTRKLRVKPSVNCSKKDTVKIKRMGLASMNKKGSSHIKTPVKLDEFQYRTTGSKNLNSVNPGGGLPWPEYWDFFLQKPSNRQQIAPVNFFKHAPFAGRWKNFAKVGLVIEVPNPFARIRNKDPYWIATVQEFTGYRAVIEFERFQINSTRDLACIPFCSDVPQPLGYSDKSNKLLRPSTDVAKLHPDFINIARRNLVNKRQLEIVLTVQENHAQIVEKEIEGMQIYQLGTKLEIIDINFLARNQIGTVTGIFGDRIHITYGVPKRSENYDLGHFLNCKSEDVHPLGWSIHVGHALYANQEDLEIAAAALFCEDLPNCWKDILKVDLAIEIIHPALPFKIVPAVVSDVLKFGYFMAKVKLNNADKCQMCFHVTSSSIFQCGFAHSHEIKIPVSDGEINPLTWETYYQRSQCEPLNLSSVSGRNRIPHNFEEGMKMEAVDLCMANVIRPVTVVKVADHLLQLHFDGQPKELPESYQWMDAESSDIYPLGWAEMVGHKFSGYPEAAIPIESPVPKIVSVRTITQEEYIAFS